MLLSMPAPGFLRGGINPIVGGGQPIIWPKFVKNCMKMKKLDRGVQNVTM